MSDSLQLLRDHLATASPRKSILVIAEIVNIDLALMTECFTTRDDPPRFDELTSVDHFASLWRIAEQLVQFADNPGGVSERGLIKQLWDEIKYVAIVEQDFERAVFVRDRQDWIETRLSQNWLASQVEMTCDGTVCEIEPLNPRQDMMQSLARARLDRPRHLCRLIQEVYPPELSTAAIDPRWRTSDVVGLAQAIYDDRAFERMPILADALMDAGCENEEIIGHCRGDGPHVRGCWVVDLILGKG